MPRTLAQFTVLAVMAVIRGDKPAHANAADSAQIVEAVRGLRELYAEFHRNPELSGQEVRTAAKFAERLRALGFATTTGVGGHGVVGLLKVGPGPTVMWRAELDALPIAEQTGLPFASTVTATSDEGKTVSVGHMCGHDLHMTAVLGAAALMAKSRERWRGTLMIVGQPAEERGTGARAMLADGLFKKFPRPDQALAVHVNGDAAGTVRYVSGPALASTNRAEITIHGRGGHIGAPQATVDPIVIAARTILALQTIVTRETDPRDTALVAVGAIHGGTAANVTPDQVTLSVSVRSHRTAVQQHLLEALRRVVIAEAAAAKVPKPPTIVIDPGVRAVENDPPLVARLLPVIKAAVGADNVQPGQAAMAGDDFAEFGHLGVPSVLLTLGSTEPQRFAAAKASKKPIPAVHSPMFAPDFDRTAETAMKVLLSATLELMGSGRADSPRGLSH